MLFKFEFLHKITLSFASLSPLCLLHYLSLNTSRRAQPTTNNMGKKGDPKKSLAAKAIVKLVLSLPDEIVKHWLSAAMIVSLLVSGGLRSSKISVDDVTHALNRNPAFSTRRFGFKNILCFRSACVHDQAALDPDFEPGVLPSTFFQNVRFESEVGAIDDYKNGGTVRDKTTTGCRGWSGPTYQKLANYSGKEFLEQEALRSGLLLKDMIPLASIFGGRKDSDKFVVAFSTDVNGALDFSVPSKTCSLSACDGNGLCSNCAQLSPSLAMINFQARKEIDESNSVSRPLLGKLFRSNHLTGGSSRNTLL
jgi:hypothetical protein